MLEDYVGLENLANSLPENHMLLPVGYYTFQFWELLGYFIKLFYYSEEMYFAIWKTNNYNFTVSKTWNDALDIKTIFSIIECFKMEKEKNQSYSYYFNMITVLCGACQFYNIALKIS